MTDYYFSTSGNDDTGEPDSQLHPYATIEKLNTLVLSSGDNVYFKSGDIWNLIQPGASISKILLNYSGILYGSYGAGDKPRFLAHGDNLSNGTVPWEDLENGAWFWPYDTPTPTYKGIMEDSIYLQEAVDEAGVIAGQGQWWYGTGSHGDGFYYKPTSGVPNDHRLTKLTLGNFIDINTADVSNITIQDIAIYETFVGINLDLPCSNITIKRIDFVGSLTGLVAFQEDGQVISDVLSEDCNFTEIKIAFTSGAHNNVWLSSRFTLRRAVISYCDGRGWMWRKYDGTLTSTLTGDFAAIHGQNLTDWLVEDCIFHTVGIAAENLRPSCFEFYMDPGSSLNGNIVRRNLFYNFYCYGIQIGNSFSVEVTGNEIYNNIILGTGIDGSAIPDYRGVVPHAGIRCGLYNTSNTANKIYNNTIWNCEISMDFSTGGVTGGEVKNNVSTDPLRYHVRTKASWAWDMDYNDFYPDGADKFYSTTEQDLAAFPDNGLNDRISDPGFQEINGDPYSVVPTATSPVVGTGVAGGPSSTDYFGNSLVGDPTRGACWYFVEPVEVPRQGIGIVPL